MHCTNCGKKLPDNSKFCVYCGKPVLKVSDLPKGGSDSDHPVSGDKKSVQTRPKPQMKQKTEQKRPKRETESSKEHTNGDGQQKSHIGLFILIGFIVGILIIFIGAAAAFLVNNKKETSDVLDDMPEAVYEAVPMDSDIAAEVQGESERKTGAEDGSGPSVESRPSAAVETKKETETVKETEPPYDPEEGGIHRYEYVISDCTWNQAYERAKASGGYLVHINSAAEYTAVLNEIKAYGYSNIQFKIGGRRNSGSEDYYWVDKNNNTYGQKINSDSYWARNEWMAGEPSYWDGSIEEAYLDIFYYDNGGRWVWNDIPDDVVSVVGEFSGRLGYIVEYDN